MRRPVSTYRLQMNASFDLRAVAGIADYIRQLGADWLYLSPLLTAHEGSDHGYDVVDHSTVDPARGGGGALEAASFAARRLGLGILVDIVPNHVGIGSPMTSVWWRDVLANGPASRYAEAFDIDWDAGGGRVRLPVLGDEATPDLRVVDGALRYGDQVFPLREDVPHDDRADPAEVHAAQHYELVNWRRADGELNYRRFFAVNSLAGLRVEVPWVFDASHAEIVRWIRDGLVDGLRVDHPDGLADPGGYLDALAAATAGAYVVVEKILQPGERLPASWATDGTTGYDALAEIDRVFVDADGRSALDAIDAAVRNASQPPSWDEMIHDAKRAVADGVLRSEVRRIVRELSDPCARPTDQLEDAIAELLACFPVYRSYLPIGLPHLQVAGQLARARRPELADALTELLELLSCPEQPAARRFQQTSGMVMAKGVEDQAFYRFTRLGSSTEVGADPSIFALDVDEFHMLQQQRLAATPYSMTALSTHDTKRGEDVRARLHVLAEVPDQWAELLSHLRHAVPIGDGPFEQLLWQALVGAWPVSADRLHAYAEKAAREAGVSTTWTAPDADFERTVHDAIDRVLGEPDLSQRVEQLVTAIAPAGWSNSLAAKVLQLTGPGVPDVYQGSECWEMSLVDPDNRRPVDFGERQRVLDDLDRGDQPPIDETGAAKLLVTSRCLRLRRDHPDWFWRYAPVDPVGPAGRHAVAVDRGDVSVVVTRLPVGLARRGGWADTAVSVPSAPTVDVITGRRYRGGSIEMAELFATYPVAVLAPIGEVAP